MTLLLESLGWRVELEWPEEVVHLLEVATTSPDLVDDILNTSNSLVTQGSRDWCVVSECDSLLVNLSVSSLVDKTTNIITGWVTVSDVWLDKSDHIDGGTVELNKHSIVELSQTEKLHDLLLLWWELVDTSGSDDEGDLGLSINEEVTVLLGCSLGVNKILVLLLILSGVLFGIIGSSLSGSCTILFGGSTGISTGLKELGVSGLLLQNVLWDNSCHCIGKLRFKK